MLGFVAARIAEEISGPDGYRAERTRQAEWLVERLALSDSGCHRRRQGRPPGRL